MSTNPDTVRNTNINTSWNITCMCTLALLTVYAVSSYADDDTSSPQLREWRQYSVPYYAPHTTRPDDEEFLKLLPPLRDTPQFDKHTQDMGVAVWWRDYSLFIFETQPPIKDEITIKPVVYTTPGEDEPQVMGLWGIRDVGKVTVDVANCPFPVTIRRVNYNPRKIPGDYYGDHVAGGRVIGLADYLPETNTGEVTSGRNTVFWLTVEAPKDAKSGTYKADIHITCPENNVITTSFTIVVHDYVLPPADIAYGMYFRPESSEAQLPPQYKTDEMLRMYWRDMARHGMTSATIYPSTDLHDGKGHSVVMNSKDIAKLQQMMDNGLVRKHIPVMWIGGWARVTESVAPAIAKDVADLGLPELLVYGPDEPEVGNDDVKAFFETLHPLRSYFRIVTSLSDLPALAYADYLDVFAVSSGRISPHLQNVIRVHGGEVWTYDCNNKATGNAPWSRYQAGLYTWALNLKGNFLWCYTEIYTWDTRKNALFCHVLPGPEGLVPSIQWETRREGVEDYRTLRLLESLIAEHLGTDESAQAQRWLDSIRDRADWYVARHMPPTLNYWDGIEIYPRCPNFDPSEFSDIRAEAVSFILTLKNVN